MASLNKVIIMGNLTRDIEMHNTTGGTAVGKVGLALNRAWNDKQTGQKREEVTFVDVEFWGQTAEIAAKYLHKGSPCLVEGRLKLDQWQDKTTGAKRSRLYVVGERLQLIEKRAPEQQQRAAPQQEDQLADETPPF